MEIPPKGCTEALVALILCISAIVILLFKHYMKTSFTLSETEWGMGADLEDREILWGRPHSGETASSHE
jgi:hypothetical protein